MQPPTRRTSPVERRVALAPMIWQSRDPVAVHAPVAGE
jgi:hypothetical protein